MSAARSRARIGLLSRGARRVERGGSERADAVLGPIGDALVE